MAPMEPVGWSSKIGFQVQAEVVGLPDAAVVDADVEDVGLVGNAGGADGAAAAERSDHAPFQAGIELGIEGLCRQNADPENGKENQSAHGFKGYQSETGLDPGGRAFQTGQKTFVTNSSFGSIKQVRGPAMKLAVAAFLLLAPAFAQSRWYNYDFAEARRDRIEAQREARQIRMDALRDARQARMDAQREAAYARREVAQARREAYRFNQPRWDRWDREEFRREAREIQREARQAAREIRESYRH